MAHPGRRVRKGVPENDVGPDPGPSALERVQGSLTREVHGGVVRDVVAHLAQHGMPRHGGKHPLQDLCQPCKQQITWSRMLLSTAAGISRSPGIVSQSVCMLHVAVHVLSRPSLGRRFSGRGPRCRAEMPSPCCSSASSC